jgi:hypothetical protein
MRTLLQMTTLAMLLSCVACGRGSAPASETKSTPATPTATAWNVSIEPIAVPAADHSAEPQITANDGHVLLSWIEQAGKTATLKFTERGADWSMPRTVASGSDWFVSWADVPSVMRMSDGTLVANWYRNTNVELEAYDLWMAYSRDAGATWSKPFMPHRDRTKTQHGFASLFEMPGKGLGLVWLDGRENETNKEHPEDAAIMLRYAAFDRQWKQTAEDAVNLRVCDCCQTSVAATSDGIVAAFRDRSDSEIRDIAVTRLENGKWTDPTRVHDDNWEIDSCPVNGPAVSARGQSVAAAWFTAKNNQGQAFAAFSNDGGRTWGSPIRLDDGRSNGHVDVELLDDGSAAATWVEFANQRAHFRVRRVTATGEKSSAVEIAGSGAGRVSGYPRMARTADGLLFAWTESTGGGGGDDEDAAGAQQVKAAVARLAK